MAQGVDLGLEGGAVPGVAAHEDQVEEQAFSPQQLGGVQDGEVVLAGFVAAHGEDHGQGADAEEVLGVGEGLGGGVWRWLGRGTHSMSGRSGRRRRAWCASPGIELGGRRRVVAIRSTRCRRRQVVGKADRHTVRGGLGGGEGNAVVPHQPGPRTREHDEGLIVMGPERLGRSSGSRRVHFQGTIACDRAVERGTGMLGGVAERGRRLGVG